ncbi:ABC transporter substrate-binding protein [Leptothrix discophora]|uniref:ABC transporter substrate-binding protein n=1 Tax=Leptothrix discophora TaxID=89 RepID=A0ABT9FYG6_LEPDI|nr:ABC transporter substrate-binding protein [Leptothrix discophora]MDP4299258.1 ABC transporter substrate-binding protein [Leptothrix discophora]
MTCPDPAATTRRTHLRWLGLGAAATLGLDVRAQDAAWARTEAQARGQTVYFNAWAGSEPINAYIQWAAGELQRRHGIKLEHVRITDAAEVVQRVRAEQRAGRSDGSVDLLWINGENFHAMKRDRLLLAPWAERLPSYAGVDTQGKPTTRSDFGEPVDGLEAPWGMAQLTFYGDAPRLGGAPPRSLAALLDWARRHPGRFSYPRPPQFHGTTFLKQVLLEALLLLALVPWPLAQALAEAVRQGVDPAGWQALAADPQTLPAWRLSVQTALLSSTLALLATLWIGSAWQADALAGTPRWQRRVRGWGAMLAMPHAAAAIGLLWLLMPSGWLVRLAALAVPGPGWDAPPELVLANDPQGHALVLALVVKELPFLLWMLAADWARPELAQRLSQQLVVGRSLGWPARSLAWRLLWPQMLARLRWPLLAVLAYGLTVVDMALLLGPGNPPTLAVLAWDGLRDADPSRQSQAVAAAWLLTVTLLLLAVAGRAAMGWVSNRLAESLRDGPPLSSTLRRPDGPGRLARGALTSLGGLYAVLWLVLAIGSVSASWRYPALWPQALTGQAWQQAVLDGGVLRDSVLLAAATALLSLATVIAWLQLAPPTWDRWAIGLSSTTLVLPTLLLLAGLYPWFLVWRLDGGWPGLVWVHGLMALPYVAVALQPSWRALDPRYLATARTLGLTPWRQLWSVRRPMLAAPIASALAVGWAVSLGQFLPTLFIGAGRHRTLTTEAVTLAAGGQRHAAAAFALLQALLPLAGFLLASRVGRSGRAASSGRLAR